VRSVAHRWFGSGTDHVPAGRRPAGLRLPRQDEPLGAHQRPDPLAGDAQPPPPQRCPDLPHAPGRLRLDDLADRRAHHGRGRDAGSAYLRAAGLAVRVPGETGPPPPKPPTGVSTDSHAPTPLPSPGRCPSTSACEPYREVIEEAFGHGRNAMAIWQDLVDQHGFPARYASVMRYVRGLRRRAAPEAGGTITTAPSEEAQVDYGEGPMVRFPATGKYRRTRLFLLTLGYSRKSVRLLTFHSSRRTWAELHEAAFHRLGAAPRIIILDNLREGVLAHYGVTVPPLSGAGCGSEGESRGGHRPHSTHAPQGLTLRAPGGGPGLPRSLRRTLGRHAHPRHHQAASRRDVCRGPPAPPATPADPLPLLRLRHPHRALDLPRSGEHLS
jgi:hypothetical protein